jgi:hypothetical protein
MTCTTRKCWAEEVRANARLRCKALSWERREVQPPPPQEGDGITWTRPREGPVVDPYTELTWEQGRIERAALEGSSKTLYAEP